MDEFQGPETGVTFREFIGKRVTDFRRSFRFLVEESKEEVSLQSDSRFFTDEGRKREKEREEERKVYL